VAVIGDGALTSGIAYEALNNAGHTERDLIVILNDNEMSIAPNVGAINKYLTRIRSNPLYNRVRDAGGRLVVAGEAGPAGSGFDLVDLASRLAWGPVFHLQELDDAGKRQALFRRAAARGVEMPDEVANYLISRCPRDMGSLFRLLDRLDEASLSAQRRLTIPFVRALIS